MCLHKRHVGLLAYVPWIGPLLLHWTRKFWPTAFALSTLLHHCDL